MDRSANAPQQCGNVDVKWVWLAETVALKEGQGVCYDYAYYTGTDTGHALADARRTNRVKLPTILNAPFFAGVAARAYPAASTGQFIEIYTPGSTCYILTKANLSNAVGRVTCQAGGTYAGYFTAEGFQGQGSAIPLQTKDTSTTVGKTLALLEEGPQSGLVEVLTTTTGGAITIMVGGVTHFATSTIASADATFTVADGTKEGMRKKFICDGSQTTNNYVMTVTTGLKFDGTTKLSTITMDTATNVTVIEWAASGWQCVASLGSILA